ncbi:MAG: hypothetical protein ROR55_19835 [Devosia sp.]
MPRKNQTGETPKTDQPQKPTRKKRLPGQKAKLTLSKVELALRNAAGIQSTAAAMLGVDPTTIRDWVKRYPKLNDLLADTKEDVLDLAEAKLFKQIKDGVLTAIIFYLKCHGKGRGYLERAEITTPKGQPLEVQHEIDTSKLTPDEAETILKLVGKAVEGLA